MAFNTSSMSREPVQSTGPVLPFDKGIAVLSGGSATVTTSFKEVEMAFVSSQTSNAARVSATSGATFTITGTGTDAVAWIAIGKGGR